MKEHNKLLILWSVISIPILTGLGLIFWGVMITANTVYKLDPTLYLASNMVIIFITFLCFLGACIYGGNMAYLDYKETKEKTK